MTVMHHLSAEILMDCLCFSMYEMQVTSGGNASTWASHVQSCTLMVVYMIDQISYNRQCQLSARNFATVGYTNIPPVVNKKVILFPPPLSPPHLMHLPPGNKKRQFPSTEGAYRTVYSLYCDPDQRWILKAYCDSIVSDALDRLSKALLYVCA